LWRDRLAREARAFFVAGPCNSSFYSCLFTYCPVVWQSSGSSRKGRGGAWQLRFVKTDFRQFRAVMLWIVALGMDPSLSPAAPFRDANWISMNPSFLGADGPVTAAVVDSAGNLFICGGFTVVGEVVANGIAKWNGTNWSALGSWTNASALALAVSGSDLYVGGQ